MLIKSIEEVKDVLRISNLDSNASLPDIASAEETYIIPVIGQDLYDDIQAKYDANTLSTEEQALLKLIQKPLASFAYHDDLPLHNAIITDAGVRQFDSDNMPGAHRWQVDQLRSVLITRAYQGIESLYAFLERGNFPLWNSSEGYTRRNRFLIKKAVDFADQVHVHAMHRTYNALLGIMGDVEEMYVSSLIGKDFFEDLKAETTPTYHESAVIADLKKAIANLTIHHAVEKLPVQVTASGVTVMTAASDRGESDRTQAPDTQLNLVLQATRRDGQNYLSKAKKYLDANASVSVFPVYFASSYYTAPVADEDRIDPNSQHKIFSFIR